MASSRDVTNPKTYPPQSAGTKRTRTQERQPPRKSARLEQLHQHKPISVGNSRERTCHSSAGSICEIERRAQQHQKPVSRKRPRPQNGLSTPGEPSGERRKRRRKPAQEKTIVPVSPGNLGKDEQQHPVAYWAANRQWPRQNGEKLIDMENIIARTRSRSISARSRKHSDTSSATSSSTDQGEPKSREQKSAEYRKLQYATVLATKGVLMKSSSLGVTKASQKWCKDLLDQQQTYPLDTLFRDDLFDSTCESIQDKNETRVIRDIALLIVPSAEVLLIRGATHLACLIDSVNEGWNNSIPITKTRPQPDYAVGFRREAFKQEQLDRMHPIIGDFNDQSYFMGTWYMYFPFLTCEVKCGAAALDIADRQNAHSAAIAVRAVVELFRAVKREKELHREILAFSISHDHCSARIYGYYAEFDSTAESDGAKTKYYRHTIHKFDFTALNGREKWAAYKFTKNVYDNWMPKHFERISSAIDQIPADISFSVSQSEAPYPEQSSGAYSIVQSSIGSASGPAQDVTQSSISQGLVVTPSTSVHEGAPFKKPRKEYARQTRK